MAMFPPALPHVFLHWLTKPGDVVYDPFSGRGTTVLEACLNGRIGVGSDANPFAWLLTAAKAQPPTRKKIEKRLQEIESKKARPYDPEEVPPEIQMLFARRVLSQLLSLREELDVRSATDRYLLAVLAGMLHANADRAGNPRGLTVPMPNTFAMAPGYVKNYIRAHDLKPPNVEVLKKLRERIATFPEPADTFRRGRAWRQDASRPIRYPDSYPEPKLVFASPPYLQVIKYAKFNWIRHWLLGSEPRSVDERLFTSSSVKSYLAFMSSVLANIADVMRADGYCCLVIGDVRRESDEINLAKLVAEQCVKGTALKVIGIVRDALPTQHKVSRIWGERRGRATRTDRILVLGGRKITRVPSLPRISWQTSPEG